MGRPPVHDDNTRQALLDAAEQHLAEAGPDAVGVRSVARDVGVPTRAVYSLFGSKAGLLQALAARGYRLLATEVAGLPATDDPFTDLVAAGVKGFRPFALERPGLFRLTFERVPAEVVSDSDVSHASLDSYEALTRWIRRARDAGVVADRPIEEMAFGYHACCLGLATSELSRQPPPVGSNFWRPVHGIDGEHLWHAALSAYVLGLA